MVLNEVYIRCKFPEILTLAFVEKDVGIVSIYENVLDLWWVRTETGLQRDKESQLLATKDLPDGSQ